MFERDRKTRKRKLKLDNVKTRGSDEGELNTEETETGVRGKEPNLKAPTSRTVWSVMTAVYLNWAPPHSLSVPPSKTWV